MEDASLDDFLDAGDGEPADGEPAKGEPADEEPVDGAGPDADEDGGDAADPAPTVSTYAFSPGGADCVACGETVARRWRDDGDLVCADCKRWG